MSLIVFDLDGTLIDSAPDIHAAINRTLNGEGVKALDLPTVTSFIGNGLPKLVERAILAQGLDMGDHDRLTALTLGYYSANPATLTRVYPGLDRVLSALKTQGHMLGICTNKPEAPARAILPELGLDGLFDVVVGGDTYPEKKPDPAPLLHTFQALGTGPRLYVGDSEVDAETAARAGVDFALFTEGYRKVPVAELVHTFAFDHFDQLFSFVA